MKRLSKASLNESVLRSAHLCHNSFLPYHIVSRSNHFVHTKRIYQPVHDILVDIWKTGPKSIVVSFRGSVSIKNLVSYCKNELKDFSFCEKKMCVHGGVLNLFYSIHDELLNSMGNVHSRVNHVTYTGYSLGGALAEFASLYFSLMFPLQHVTCLTFGSPLVGDKDFVSVYENVVNSSLHVVNKLDIVPLLLPVQLSCNTLKNTYKSMPEDRIIYLDSKNTMIELKHVLRNPLHSHDINTYIENIENMLQCNKGPIL